MNAFLLLAVLLMLNVPVYRRVGKAVFGDMEEFKTCMKYVLTPDLVSLWRGEYRRDIYATFKAWLFLLVSAAVVAAEFLLIARLLGLLDRPVGPP